MAVSVAECRQMIDACHAADRKLMLAYRSQHEPMTRTLRKMVKDGRLSKLKELISTNSQNMSDPGQWRLKKALAGGGPLPDVGVYCLNGVHFLSGEEPSEVIAWTHSTPGDARFREVEETVQFMLRFPGRLHATCPGSYGAHKAQMLRLMGSAAWAELDPAYADKGIRLRHAQRSDDRIVVSDPAIAQKDQFALEMDHMALCVRSNRSPYFTGEDDLQDQRTVKAIYTSAHEGGKTVKLMKPASPVRDAEPEEGA